MFSIQSLILVLIQFALFVCITCRSRSVDSHATTISVPTECPTLIECNETLPECNDKCVCDGDSGSTMIVMCSSFESFPIFKPLKLNNTYIDLSISGTFGELPSECISPLVGEGTVVFLQITGTGPNPYTKLQVDSKAFVTDYAKSTEVGFGGYEFSLFPTEALAVNSIANAQFGNCKMTVISDNSFYDFSGNFLFISNCEIEEFEQYAFNGTGTGSVTINENPFSQIDPAFKLIRTTQLDLSYNNISTIPDYALCECDALSGCTNIIAILSLSYNPLVSISDLAFANLPGLIELDMDNCLLVKIPTMAINTVPSLTKIDLSNNLLTNVEPNSFVSLQHLQSLYLQGNPIIVIQPGAFNSLLFPDLGIYSLKYLTSVDAAVTYGIKNVHKLIISNCPKFEEITLNNYKQLPGSLNSIYAPILNVKRVSSNFDFWLQLTYANKLTISDNYNYNCTSDISWMSKYVFCPHEQIEMDNTKCANTNQPLKSYLQQLEPKPDCIQHSSAAFLKNSSKFFTLCILFIYFYLFSTFK